MSLRVFVLLCGCAVACAQVQTAGSFLLSPLPQSPATPNPNAKRYNVTGTVTNSVTNQAVARALVHLSSGPEQYAVLTGSDGRFMITDVLEGAVWLSAERPGYFDLRTVDNSAQNPARATSFAPVGPGNNDFHLFLVPEAQVVGTVLDENGEPIEGVSVRAIGARFDGGRRQWMVQGESRTDENGEYRLDGQMPGPAIICVASRSADMFEQEQGQAYGPRCYPDSPDSQSAQPIALGAGESARADLTLRRVRTHSVSGVIRNATSVISGFLQQAGTDMADYSNPLQINPANGRFLARSVPDGTWKLRFQAPGKDRMLQAQAEVVVNRSDVSGVDLTLSEGIEIPVQVVAATTRTAESRAPPASPAVRPALESLRLIPTDGSLADQIALSQLQSGNEGPNAPLRLALVGVSPGSYTVLARSGPNCIGSISYGGTDVSREPLTVAGGSEAQTLTVTTRSDCATLSIHVEMDRPDGEGTLIVVPESSVLEPQLQPISAGKTLQISGLTPGAFRLYAVSSVAGLAYADAQAMSGIPSQTVTLDPNGAGTVTLHLYERGR